MCRRSSGEKSPSTTGVRNWWRDCRSDRRSVPPQRWPGRHGRRLCTRESHAFRECHAALSLALSGVGIIYGAEPILRPHLDDGALRLVLQDWASMGPGFHIYYSGRRQVPTALRLLVDLIRELSPLR
ncbi:hypothetical protein KZX42_00690 [Brevundimonas sp. EYE_349]|nr:hypothetical protein [Brevundimonas sp. EYE_349]